MDDVLGRPVQPVQLEEVVRLIMLAALMLSGCAIPLGDNRGTIVISMRVDYFPPHNFNPQLRGYKK